MAGAGALCRCSTNLDEWNADGRVAMGGEGFFRGNSPLTASCFVQRNARTYLALRAE
jgi:hypothetical protein